MDDFDKTVLRSRIELPYPMNYLYHENPAAAYLLIKIFDKMKEQKPCVDTHA